jgi:hypothetical protein
MTSVYSDRSKLMRRVTRLALVGLMSVGLGMAGCSGDDGGNNNGNGDDGDVGMTDSGVPGDGGSTGDAETNDGNLTINFSNSSVPLPALGGDHVWEGWLVGPTGTSQTSTGRFEASEVGDDGKISFQVAETAVTTADKFVLSIEPASNDDPGPSATKYLSGTLSDSSADLTIDGVIGDFSNAQGVFAMKTPTSSSTNDENQGVWFIQPDTGSPPSAGFSDLPDLTDKGWKYEGWVVDRSNANQPNPYTTGKFGTDGGSPTWEQQDQDGAGQFAGSMSDNFPPRPGSDFVTAGDNNEGFDLKTGEWFVVLSVEPQPDNGAEPFALKPFSAKIETDDETATALSLSYNDDSLPSGQVTID